MNKKTNNCKYLNMKDGTFSRRKFFSQVITQSTAPFKESNISFRFQGVTAAFSQNTTSKEILVFTEGDRLETANIKGFGYVSFLNWPHKKTDSFFEKLLTQQNLSPQKCYAVTTEIPLNSLNFWDKIVWISQEIPDKLPDLSCPILIIQDISHFNPERSPAELLPHLPDKSDIFISQQLDLSDKNNPSVQRIHDFLNAT